MDTSPLFLSLVSVLETITNPVSSPIPLILKDRVSSPMGDSLCKNPVHTTERIH